MRRGLYPIRTTRRGHWRRTHSGKVTHVRPHYMTVHKKKKYPPFYLVRERIGRMATNEAFNVPKAIFPQYSPLIETGRFLYVHKDDLVKPSIKTIFSDESAESKLEKLSNLATKATVTGTREKAISHIANELTYIIFAKDRFNSLNSDLRLNLSYQNQKRIEYFFRSTVKEIMRGSL